MGAVGNCRLLLTGLISLKSTRPITRSPRECHRFQETPEASCWARLTVLPMSPHPANQFVPFPCEHTGKLSTWIPDRYRVGTNMRDWRYTGDIDFLQDPLSAKEPFAETGSRTAAATLAWRG